jgi:hypothetical protein
LVVLVDVFEDPPQPPTTKATAATETMNAHLNPGPGRLTVQTYPTGDTTIKVAVAKRPSAH